MISKNKLAVVVGPFLGHWHLVWSLLVASGPVANRLDIPTAFHPAALQSNLIPT